MKGRSGERHQTLDNEAGTILHWNRSFNIKLRKSCSVPKKQRRKWKQQQKCRQMLRQPLHAEGEMGKKLSYRFCLLSAKTSRRHRDNFPISVYFPFFMLMMHIPMNTIFKKSWTLVYIQVVQIVWKGGKKISVWKWYIYTTGFFRRVEVIVLCFSLTNSQMDFFFFFTSEGKSLTWKSLRQG